MTASTPARKAKQADPNAGADAHERGVCAHCGDDLAGLKIARRQFAGDRAEHLYCCLGCAFIAEQLHFARASGCDIGQIEAAAPVGAAAGGERAVIPVRGMVCSACALLIEHRLRRAPGVLMAQVDFAARRAYVSFDDKRTTPADLHALIERAGYRTDTGAAAERREARTGLLRVLIAWLAMMQVMMLAIPSYITEPGDVAPDIEQLLRIAQLALTMPVALFSGWPFLRAAANQLRAGQIGVDLPIVLGLTAAFGASVWAVAQARGAVYFDSITMFVALVLAARWLQARALKRAAEHIEALDRRTVMQARRLRDFPRSGAVETVVAEHLRAADHVLVAPGETIPADGVVASGASAVSQAWLTGESTPVEKTVGGAVLAGSVNLEQPLIVTVTRAGRNTSLAALRRLVDEAGRDRPRLVELANRVAVYFLWTVIGLTLATLLAWHAIDPSQALRNAIALLVATCPCALSLAAPAALTAAQSALARRGILTARGAALQAAARVDVVASDKTGTLTTAAPDVARTVLLRESSRESSHESSREPAPEQTGQAAQHVLGIAAGLESASTHPYARALLDHAAAEGAPIALVRAARVEGAGGVEGVIAGVTYRIGRADFARALGPDGAPGSARRAAAAWSRFDDLIRARAGAGTGTGIGVGTGIGHAVLADADGPLAVFIFSETIRSDAREFAAQVRGGGAQLILLSGDRREAVARVASALDVEQWYANQTPDSKRQLIGQMQNEGHVVAMLGDGMNDAPVLAQADVSIALAEGSSLAQARADFIVVSARLSEVAQVFDGARRVMRIIRQNLAGAFVYNMSVIPLAAFGYLTPALAAAGMAASSLLVVANALRARRV